MKHYTVLKKESIEGLNIKDSSVIVDATLGYAGDSSEILRRIKRGFLFAFDRDQDAIEYSSKELSKIGSNFQIIHSNYENMKCELEKCGVSHVDGILFDLGVSSPQLDENRGFSFMRDEVLDMRMDKRCELDAKVVLNTYSYNDLRDIMYRYGEEKLSGVIASRIVKEREKKEIRTTKELVSIIESAVGAKYYYKNHPERKVFQAIRIEVNQELKSLENALPQAIELLNPGGRLVVVTFHSLEDRIVKQVFKKYSEVPEPFKGLPEVPKEFEPKVIIINKKPILPSEEELIENTRSASAKLRIVERV